MNMEDVTATNVSQLLRVRRLGQHVAVYDANLNYYSN